MSLLCNTQRQRQLVAQFYEEVCFPSPFSFVHISLQDCILSGCRL